MRKALPIIALLYFGWSPWAFGACPDLRAFYDASDGYALGRPAWEDVRLQLSKIFDQCLQSSEYFALYGAAQLNTGRLPESMESLERSLMLDPDNGAALIDYADALLRDGQLFAAIEANALLLVREDVPDDLELQINQRHRDWNDLISQTSLQLDLTGGFDSNLNGAPDEEVIQLTLSGEPIFLTLNEAFRSVEGPFLNINLMAQHRRLAPDSQHSFLGQVRGRMSEDNASDVFQVAGRYSQLIGRGRRSAQWGVGLNHLLFSGKPLFTGADARYRFQLGRSGKCRRFANGALQNQIWHEQRRLDGVEIKAGIGVDCPLAGKTAQRINLEGSFVRNIEANDNRLGGDRNGLQFEAAWRMALSEGILSAQFNYTQLRDARGFSPLLEGNARRFVERSSVFLQYRKDIDWPGDSAQLLIRLYHQDQNSNLGLFETEDTSFELGLRWLL